MPSRTSRRPGRGTRWSRRGALVAAGMVVATAASTAAPVVASADTGEVAVIVQQAQGHFGAAAAVQHLGGHITRNLAIIDGFAASVPASSLPALSASPEIASVTSDAAVHSEGASYDAGPTDGGSMYNVTQITGAQAYWAKGYTGAGVGVAVIDSGVAPVDGLTAPGKVVYGPDLSFESQAANLTDLDTFGHGTHMAGIIAGRADAAVPGKYTTDTTNFVGMAPDAKIISLKVADHDGATDVSQMIAAIDWVVQHRNDPGLNIKVLNLSYGTDAANDYKVDPLAYAVEQAWKSGIFVVAASGNDGFVKKTGSMTMPAKDPNIMAVGAVDTAGTDTMTDDKIPSFSSTGSDARRVDVVAPGAHIVSLRAPGSSIDQANASTGAVTPELFRGSGTSQATAVVSGAAALVLQQYPNLAPTQLKNLLMATAFKLPSTLDAAQGKGELNLTKAMTQKPGNAPVLAQPASTGTGTLDGSRGSSRLTADGVTLSGEVDIFGNAWNSQIMAALAAYGFAWRGGSFNGATWSGSGWSGSRWSDAAWSGSRWSGSRWSDSSWSASVWDGSRWSDDDWSGSRWSGSRWSDGVWAGATWS